MTDEVLNEKDFIINLTIDGTEYEDVEVKVTKPELSIREQIQRIIDVFELPKVDSRGNPRPYGLGQILEDEDEPAVLEFLDEAGNTQSLIDYNIKNGDHLHLLEPPLYGCFWEDDEQSDSNNERVEVNMDKKDKDRKPFWRHILYGCWL